MAYHLRISSGASTDLTESIEWYLNYDLNKAKLFISSYKECISQVSTNPLSFPIFLNNVRKARMLPPFPFNIFYRLQVDEIEVIAVFHDKRNLQNWIKRV